MDVLSEVLRVVRLSGAIHFRGAFSHPWAFSSSRPEMLAARLIGVPGASVTPFHVFTEGTCWVTTGALDPIRIEPGDVIIFPRGDQHIMASALDIAPVPIKDIYSHPTRDITELSYGGDGACSRFICGFLNADQQFDPLLSSLPAMLWVRQRGHALELETIDAAGRNVYAVEQRQEVEWWQASLRYLIAESAQPGPGNRAVLARLSESLFVEVLRWQLRHATNGHGGWLAGLHDPQVGRVLNLIHALPARPWTVDELAREAAISRAALARRFVELVGQSPIHYLASWRMQLARHLLRDSGLGIGEIAGRVGYESEAAFNRAFRRLVGAPPAAWRNDSEHRPA